MREQFNFLPSLRRKWFGYRLFSSCIPSRQESWKEIVIRLLPTAVTCSIGGILFYVLLQAIYTETYVWQVTTLGSSLHPVTRNNCPIPHHSGDAPSSKRKIGVLMIYNDADGNWNKDLMKKVIKNREKYCNKYGFDLINGNALLDLSRPPAWSKLKAMDHYLASYDYLMYIDMDVVIMNYDHDINEYIDINPSKDFIMTEDWSGVNTGVWIAKNTKFAHWFLQTAWNQTDLIPPKSPTGIPYPFEYEQRAFHFLLNTKKWQDRHLQKYRGDSNELLGHFLILPQCSMNSYIMYPYYWIGNREVSHYVEGDFLVHFAGKKGRVKTNLMNHFLDLA